MPTRSRFLDVSSAAVSVLVVAVAVSACASNSPVPAEASVGKPTEPQAAIAFANRGGIVNWQPRDDRSLWIEGTGGQWYLVQLQSPSLDLAFTEQLGFEPGPSGALARLDAVVIKGLRYPIISLSLSDAPAPKGTPGKPGRVSP